MISYGLLGKAMRTGLAVCDPQIAEIIQQSCGMGARDVEVRSILGCSHSTMEC